MEGRTTPKGPISPLHSKSAPKRSISPFYNTTPTASVSSSNQNNTPIRSISPFYNKTPTASVSSSNQNNTPKRSVSPFLNKTPTTPISSSNQNTTPKRSISPFYNKTPTASVSSSNQNNTPKRSVSPFLNKTPTAPISSSNQNTTPKRSISPFYNKTPTAPIPSSNQNKTPKRSSSPMHQTLRGSVSPLHTRTPKGSVSPLHSTQSTTTGSSLHALIPKRSPSPLPFRSSSNSNSGSNLPNVTPKRSVSPFVGKSAKSSVLNSRNPPKGSVLPLHDKASSLSSTGSVSPLHTQTPKRSVSPFQHGTPKRSVSPFQHQTPKGSVSPSQSPHQTSEFSNSLIQSEEKVTSDLIPPQTIQEESSESSNSHSHDEEKSPERSVSPLRTKEKPTPNYLKASSGTCHDVCKYGGRHEFDEEKGKSSKNLKIRGKNNGERRKKTVIKLRSLSSGKIVFSEKIEIIVEGSSGSYEEEAGNGVEWQDIKAYDDDSVRSEEAQNEGECNSSDVIAELVERRSKKLQVLKSKESNEKDVFEKKDAVFRKKKELNKRLDGMKENTLLNERKGNTSGAKLKLYEVSEENTGKGVNKSSKAISRTMAESSPKKKASIFAILRSGSARRSLELGKNEKGVANRAKKGSSNTASTSSSSNNDTKEKVLHVIEPKTRIKTGTKSTEEKSPFRRGKVVELPPPDPGTATKRLKFRQRRSSENLAGFQIGRRSFRRKGSISSGGGGAANSHGQVVVLRHRETEEKKGIQGLFNSIIEETVNKLVKTRKSKVKALVGAFETVISLQDSKPVK